MSNFKKFDRSKYLTSKEQIGDYLKIMLDENGTEGFLAALGDIAKAEGMAKVAKQTGLGRESLYKSLSKNGNPNFTSVIKTLKTLDIDLSFKKIDNKAKERVLIS